MLPVKVFFILFAIAAAYTDIDDKYHDILIGDRIKLKQFYMCLVDISPCDSFGEHVKS